MQKSNEMLISNKEYQKYRATNNPNAKERKKIDNLIKKRSRALEKQHKKLSSTLAKYANSSQKTYLLNRLEISRTQHLNRQRKWELTREAFHYHEKLGRLLPKLTQRAETLARKDPPDMGEVDTLKHYYFQHKENLPILTNHLSRMEGGIDQDPNITMMTRRANQELQEMERSFDELKTAHPKLLDKPIRTREQRISYYQSRTAAKENAINQLARQVEHTDRAQYHGLKKVANQLKAHRETLHNLARGNMSNIHPSHHSRLETNISVPAAPHRDFEREEAYRLGRELSGFDSLPVTVRGVNHDEMIDAYIEYQLTQIGLAHELEDIPTK